MLRCPLACTPPENEVMNAESGRRTGWSPWTAGAGGGASKLAPPEGGLEGGVEIHGILVWG